MQPLAFAENRWVRVGTGSDMTGLLFARGTLALHEERICHVARRRAKGGKEAPS